MCSSCRVSQTSGILINYTYTPVIFLGNWFNYTYTYTLKCFWIRNVTWKIPTVFCHRETKGRFRKRVVLANAPSFRFSFRGTCECTLVPVVVPGEHLNVPSFRLSFRGNIRQNHPFGTTLFSTPDSGGIFFCNYWCGDCVKIQSRKCATNNLWTRNPRGAVRVRVQGVTSDYLC